MSVVCTLEQLDKVSAGKYTDWDISVLLSKVEVSQLKNSHELVKIITSTENVLISYYVIAPAYIYSWLESDKIIIICFDKKVFNKDILRVEDYSDQKKYLQKELNKLVKEKENMFKGIEYDLKEDIPVKEYHGYLQQENFRVYKAENFKKKKIDNVYKLCYIE